MRRFLAVLVKVLLGVVMFASILAIGYALLPKGPRNPMPWDDPTGVARRPAAGERYAAVTGSPQATEAAMRVMEAGGNAADAAVAALLVLNVTNGEAAGFPGIAPTLVYSPAAGTVASYVGAGTAPSGATIDVFTDRRHRTVPDLNILSQLVPASPDVIVRLLADYGTMTFTAVAADAIRIAREGFAVTATMQKNLDFSVLQRIGFTILFPYNAKVYLDGQWWRPLHRGDRFTRPDLAGTWAAMAAAESAALARGDSRTEALSAVRRYFYEGPPAEAIVQMHERGNGLITAFDLASYRGSWEDPIAADWAGPASAQHSYRIFTNGAWTQGIVVPMTLKTLERIDLASMGHNSPEYIHTVTQALELAFADREGYVGDPAFVRVPVSELLSDGFASRRRLLMQPSAFGRLPAPGAVPGYLPWVPPEAAGDSAARPVDTTQLVVADGDGLVVAMTPSDFPKSPMVPGTGMTLGNRMVQFRLDDQSPTALEPGKRPRVTPHAVMVFRDAEFWLAFNTPGGDVQPQTLVQVFLNLTVFGMTLQEAIMAPRFSTRSVPSSFSPHEADPGELWLEGPLYAFTGIELAARGYHVAQRPLWDNEFGAVGAIIRTGTGLVAAADPREATWAAAR